VNEALQLHGGYGYLKVTLSLPSPVPAFLTSSTGLSNRETPSRRQGPPDLGGHQRDHEPHRGQGSRGLEGGENDDRAEQGRRDSVWRYLLLRSRAEPS
jgi:hypothetical protein